MRIAIDLTSLFPPATGTGNYAHALLHELLHLDPINHYALLLHASHGNLPQALETLTASTERVEVRRSHWNPSWLHRTWRALHWPSLEKLAGSEVDILHLPTPGPLPPAQDRTRFVMTLSELNVLRTSGVAAEAQQVQLREWLNRCAAILCHTHFIRNEAVTKLGIDPNRLHVAPLGVDTQRFHPLEDNVAHELVRRDGPLLPQSFFLVVGSSTMHQENLKHLFSAYHLLKKKMQDPPKIVCVGHMDSATLSHAQKSATNAKLHEDVFFVGRVPPDLLAAFYNLAVACVAPDAYAGHGMHLLEAMACGAPVIASSIEPFRETAANAPLYVSPDAPEEMANALQTVASSPACQVELRKRGLEHAYTHSWHECARKTLAAYESAAQS
ncbi:TPA: hypothetical protein DDW35_00550 [Candidatus Sumerlaeota bacterium]|nr:hypothetical protein [Candidatus Sumerlaeota bacterium]